MRISSSIVVLKTLLKKAQKVVSSKEVMYYISLYILRFASLEPKIHALSLSQAAQSHAPVSGDPLVLASKVCTVVRLRSNELWPGL